MKKLFITLVLLPLLFFIMGCPVDTKYPLSEPGTEKIDKSLIGTWSNDKAESDADVIKVKIRKKDDYTYKVEVMEKGSMYMADTTLFEGFVTKFEGRDFFYVKPVGIPDKYYLYHYILDGNTLKTHDVGLKVGGLDAVTSTEAFREEVAASLKQDDCLSEEITWKKAD